MRLGIISDVHGDYSALTKVLDRLDKIHQVEHILCAGDLVGRGPQQERVVNLIRQRKIICVRGNHDEWLYDLDDEDMMTYLKELPVDWRGQFNGHTVYMCHGKPGNNMWGMYRDHLSEVYLNMVLSSLKSDVLVTGHTHMPLYMRVDEGCVVNPGSLYTFKSSRETSHTYGVLTLPDMTFEVFDVMQPANMPLNIEG